MKKLCQIYPKIKTILPLKSLFVSILSKFDANLRSILCQNTITKSVELVEWDITKGQMNFGESSEREGGSFSIQKIMLQILDLLT